MSGARALSSFAILAALGVAGWFILDAFPDPTPGSDGATDAARVAHLEAENEWLRREIGRLKLRDPLTTEAIPEAPKGPELEGAALGRSRRESLDEGLPSPALLINGMRRALKSKQMKLVASYQVALVASGRSAVDPLLAVLRDPSESAPLRWQVIATLQQLNTPALQPALADLVGRTDTPTVLRVQAMTSLEIPRGGAVPQVVLNLVTDPESDPQMRSAALRIVVRAQPEEAIAELRRRVASEDMGERKLALVLMREMPDPVLLPVIHEAVEQAGDPNAIRSLLDVLAVMKGKKWATIQMTGAPDTPIAGDIGTAWASETGDMGTVWIELDYQQSVVPDTVRIHETYNPNAVSQILAKQPGGRWTVLWEGEAYGVGSPRWFEPPLRRASYRTRTIRIVLETNRVKGWNEIDAVELIGDGRRQWAIKARASSSYAGE